MAKQLSCFIDSLANVLVCGTRPLGMFLNQNQSGLTAICALGNPVLIRCPCLAAL